jgi:hypothetical protein
MGGIIKRLKMDAARHLPAGHFKLILSAFEKCCIDTVFMSNIAESYGASHGVAEPGAA